jgi:hypothetical protein
MARAVRTEEKLREAFIEALAATANVSAACKNAGLPRRTAYDWKNADPRFAQAWEAALELGTDALEDEAIRRAHEGTLKPIYQGGKKVGTVREYSDTLMIFMLKARRPERFKDRVAAEHTGKGGGPIEHEHRHTMTDEQLEAIAGGSGH